VNSAGTSGSSGDGGAAVSAQLNWPEGLAVWGGRLVICDRYNNRLRSVDLATRIITTLGGDGTAGSSGVGGDVSAARFNQPISLSVLPDGSLVVVDLGGCMARRVTAGGVVQSFLGTGTCSSTGNGGSAISATVNNPIGVAWENTTGVLNVYVGEYTGLRVSARVRCVHSAVAGDMRDFPPPPCRFGACGGTRRASRCCRRRRPAAPPRRRPPRPTRRRHPALKLEPAPARHHRRPCPGLLRARSPRMAAMEQPPPRATVGWSVPPP
jgi:hypothetical protein